MKRVTICLTVLLSMVLFNGCILEALLVEQEGQAPTKTLMEGVWQVAEAYNEDSVSIIDDISFPITAFHLSSDRTIISTAGPMWMYIVYGDSKYTEIASKIDQVFNYAGLDFNGGEFFIEGGIVDRFTIEMKLEGLPGQKALTELLELFNIGNDWLDAIIYHKFYDVKVSFAEATGDTMYWEFDDVTSAVYNTKNSRGDYVLWQGWPADRFSRCSFTLVRKSKDLKQLVEEAQNN